MVKLACQPLSNLANRAVYVYLFGFGDLIVMPNSVLDIERWVVIDWLIASSLSPLVMRKRLTPSLPFPLPSPLSYAGGLAEAADVSPAGAAFLSALYAGACREAFRLRCSRVQLEAFVRALANAVTADMADWPRSAGASFSGFREDVLLATVERSPHSNAILNPVQATGAVNYALRAYYQNHALYKTVCAREPTLDLLQRSASGVVPPPVPPPLASAMHLL